MNKTTALRNIDRGQPARDKRWHVYACEHDGRLWITNSYWAAPADWFSGLVLPEQLSVGTYDAKLGERLWDDAPNISSLWPRDDQLQPLEPALHNGRPIIVDRGEHGDLALFVLADGVEVALNRAYVDMLRDHLPRWARSCVGGTSDALVLKGRDALKPVVAYHRTSITYADGRQDKGDNLRPMALIMPVRLS